MKVGFGWKPVLRFFQIMRNTRSLSYESFMILYASSLSTRSPALKLPNESSLLFRTFFFPTDFFMTDESSDPEPAEVSSRLGFFFAEHILII
jgi:hypothetical protein